MQLGRMTRGKMAAVALVAAVAGGGGGAAWAASTSSASAATPTPTTAAPATAPTTKTPASGSHSKAAGTHKKAKSVLDRTDHATVELRKGTTWVTTTYDRGTVTAASASSITLHRPDGQNVTIAITPTTKFKGVTSATQLATGKDALVLSTGGKATRIAERS